MDKTLTLEELQEQLSQEKKKIETLKNAVGESKKILSNKGKLSPSDELFVEWVKDSVKKSKERIKELKSQIAKVKKLGVVALGE